MFGAVAECIGIISHGAVYAVVFGQHLYELTQDIVGLFDAFFCIDCHFGRIHFLVETTQHFTENGREQVLYHFLVVVMRLVVYLCHKQVPVESEDFVALILPDRLYRIVVDMHNGVPCVFLHLDYTLQELCGECRKPYLMLRAYHCMADSGVGKAEQQVARFQLVSFVVDVQLDASFQTDGNEEASQPYCVITVVRTSLQAVDYDEVIVYIVKYMFVVLEVCNSYGFYVLFFHILLFCALQSWRIMGNMECSIMRLSCSICHLYTIN